MSLPISHQIQYVNIKGKDYIYVVDSEGNTNVVGRNGKNVRILKKFLLNHHTI